VRPRTALAAAALAAVALFAWAMARGGPGPAATVASQPRPAAAAQAPTPPPSPPVETRRNVFRFADERSGVDEARGPGGPARASVEAPVPEPTAEPGPRLVGLVRRGDRVVAAFAAPDGEVDLAGPGEAAGEGYVVVAIAGEAVRVRRPDGTEMTLVLP
jgi:hypothetical protein